MDFLQSSLSLQLWVANKFNFFMCKVTFNGTGGLINRKRYKTIGSLESVKLVLALHLWLAKILGLHRRIIIVWLLLHSESGSECLLLLVVVLYFLCLLCCCSNSKSHMLGGRFRFLIRLISAISLREVQNNLGFVESLQIYHLNVKLTRWKDLEVLMVLLWKVEDKLPFVNLWVQSCACHVFA